MLGRTVLDRYEIIRPIGQGSMGQVWLARDRLQPRHAVVKLLHERVAGQPHYRELFVREIQAMARFRHPHAVELYDASLDDPAGPCLVMEHVPGVGLDALLEQRRFLMPERVGTLLIQICQALHAAHTAGLVHRDLKPANLLVVGPDGPNEFLKVMDLGLAQLAARPHIPLEKFQGSADDYAAGSPAYVCPEQLRGDPCDRRGDIYSLGVVLFELLTGRLPFDLPDPLAILSAHVNLRPPTFKEVGMGILPRPVEQVVQQCLAKFPNERPQSAYELAGRFQVALGRSGDLDARAFQPTGGPAPEAAAAPPPGGDGGERIVEALEAWMPEPVAAMKLRGFVEEVGGRVVASEPGLIRVALDPPAKKKSSVFFNWLTGQPPPPPTPPPLPRDPMVIELHMTKRDRGGKSRLELQVVFRAVSGPLPDDPLWRAWCQELLGKLKAYLMA
jgi:serine/threonine protein kinase